MAHPLYICFIWHMHQPEYRDPLLGGKPILPWVRLHGIKDYLDMVLLLSEFPSIHQTFNLVPCLVDQLEGLCRGEKDLYWELSEKKAEALSPEEKELILRNFFTAHWANMVGRFPRYQELLEKRGRQVTTDSLKRARSYFTSQDFLDLQCFLNLVWFDPSFQETLPDLSPLIQKGLTGHFTEGDKATLLASQEKILRQILPAYRMSQEEGKIEVSTSPYFHPILPLLCDTQIARVSVPDLPLPEERFRHPEDAKWHLESAVAHYKKHFKCPPRGLWPSEGSVSEEVLDLAALAGFHWAATDEEILFKTLKKPRDPSLLYTFHRYEKGGRGISLLFRDKNLSDMIGFRYAAWSAREAAKDFLGHLRKVRDLYKNDKAPHVVGVILDGENAWEHYANDGRDFLRFLYEGISQEPSLKAVTVSEALEQFETLPSLDTIFPGSWIAGNFRIWIGHPEKNMAWECLEKARQEIVRFSESHPGAAPSKAWQALYAAEGSDWNWWYGEDNASLFDKEFDQLFRNHVSQVYCAIGLEIPPVLQHPIHRAAPSLSEPLRWTTPVLDGKETTYFEWRDVGVFDFSKQGGAMHRAEGFLRRFYYGFNRTTLFFRVDFDQALLKRESPLILRFSFKEGGVLFEQKVEKGRYERDGQRYACAIDDILEMGIAWELLKAKEGEELLFSISLIEKNLVLEEWPPYSLFRLKRPTQDFESRLWSA